MKKLFFIPILFFFLNALSQTDTALGKHYNFIPLPPLSIPSTWLIAPNSHTLYFDSSKLNIYLQDISGLVSPGTNMTRTGSGTTADPYVFNATSGGSGSSDSLKHLFVDTTANVTGNSLLFNASLHKWYLATIVSSPWSTGTYGINYTNHIGIGTTADVNYIADLTSATVYGIRITAANNANAILINSTGGLIRWSSGSYIGSDKMYTGTADFNFNTYDGAAVQSRLFIKASNGNIGIGSASMTGTSNSTLQVGGSFATSYISKTTTYTATISDHTIDCTGGGTFTVTLPTAVGITGREYVITNSGTGTITIATTSSQTFTNVTATPTSLTITSYGTYKVQSTGAAWVVTSKL